MKMTFRKEEIELAGLTESNSSEVLDISNFCGQD